MGPQSRSIRLRHIGPVSPAVQTCRQLSLWWVDHTVPVHYSRNKPAIAAALPVERWTYSQPHRVAPRRPTTQADAPGWSIMPDDAHEAPTATPVEGLRSSALQSHHTVSETLATPPGGVGPPSPLQDRSTTPADAHDTPTTPDDAPNTSTATTVRVRLSGTLPKPHMVQETSAPWQNRSTTPDDAHEAPTATPVEGFMLQSSTKPSHGFRDTSTSARRSWTSQTLQDRTTTPVDAHDTSTTPMIRPPTPQKHPQPHLGEMGPSSTLQSHPMAQKSQCASLSASYHSFWHWKARDLCRDHISTFLYS